MSKRTRIFLCFVLITLILSCNSYQAKQPVQSENFPLEMIWETKIKDGINVLAVSDKLILAGSFSGITALDPMTGNQLWNVEFALESESPIMLTEDRVIAQTVYSAMVFDRSGQEFANLSIAEGSGEYYSLLAAFENYLFVIKNPFWILEVYDITTGDLAWDASGSPGGLDFGYDPLSGLVYVASNGSIRAFELVSGNLIWEESLDVHVCTYETDILYCYGKVNSIFAFDVEKRIKLWKTNALSELQTEVNRITTFTDTIMVNTNWGMTAIDRASGEYLWTSEAIGDYYVDSILLDNVYYAKDAREKRLYAISPIDGHTIGYLQLGQPPFLVQSYTDYVLGFDEINNRIIIPVGDTLYAYGK